MLKLYNTLSRKKEAFESLEKNKINFFVCGPTVYSDSHIGHAKTYIQFDVIVKYLRYLGYKVNYLMNITDIDDKIIKRANEEKRPWKEISRGFEREFKQDMKSLSITSVNRYARATEYIEEIKSQVQRLIDKGCAYKISDGYYFDLTKFSNYGKLARRIKEHTEDAVSRIDENKEKKNKGDFCLWKFSKKGEPTWKFSLGNGRSGWHIEDTAITEREFGSQYDIHGGAVDLIFPHHEAEIAQMESISGKKPLVRYWLHTAFLNIEKEKMSKSLGNIISIKDVLKKYDGKVLRYFFISQHYRTPITFSYEILKQSKNALGRLNDFVSNLKYSKKKDDLKLIEKTKKKFLNAMNDDFDTPKALAVIFGFVREVNKEGGGKRSYAFMIEVDRIFNIFNLGDKIPNEVKKLAEERERERKENNWKNADEIREKIKNFGYVIEDSDSEYKIKKVW